MKELMEILKQIADLAGIALEAVSQAGGGESGNAAPEEGAPPPQEGGAPVPPGQ